MHFHSLLEGGGGTTYLKKIGKVSQYHDSPQILGYCFEKMLPYEWYCIIMPGLPEINCLVCSCL